MNYSTIYELITIKADITPEVSAILAPGRSPINYLQVKQQIEETIGFLNNYGIGRNDRVAIVLPNGPEMALAFLSISSGATSAPLNPNYGATEFEFYLSDLNAKAVVILSGFESPVREVAQSLSIQIIDLIPKFNSTDGFFEFVIASGRTSSTSSTGIAEANDIALILHTSGTTSRPKIVPLTHKNLCTSAENIRSFYRLSNNDCCLNVMPLFHIHGLIGGTLSSLAGGGCVVCTSGFDGGKFFEWIEEYHPTWYTAVPTMHQAVISQAQDYARTISNHKIRFIRSCSSALPPKVMGELENLLKVPVLEAYGMTEASHQMTSNPMPPKQRKPGSVGVPTGVEVEIMDIEGNFQETGEFGEIVIRGENVTLGYENNPDANEKAFTHGWFHTGDQGFLDEDGYLFITGRLKEIINRGGEKISPREIDEVLLEHPAVAQAVAFAIPHPTLGEDLAAAVVLKEDAAVEQKEIREYAFEHLADFKVPSQILIVDEIPKGATGKLQRIGLYEKLELEIRCEFVPPRNEVEVAIAMIWNEVLGNEQVGVYDNFFQLGGDSLSATQLVSRLRSIFRVEIPLGTIFREPTISEQAVVIESMILKEIEEITEEEAKNRIG